MAKTICRVLGVVFVLVGIAGFFNDHLLSAHLDKYHNVVHIVSGVVALYFGFAGSVSAARAFCLIFGVLYLGLGILGLAVGAGPEKLWAVGPLHFGTADHAIHVLLGVILLAGGLLQKRG